MATPYYQDDAVTLYHGRCEDLLPTIETGGVQMVLTDPPYSKHTHKSVRSAKMVANDRGGKYGSDTRRNVDLGFDHLTAELREFCAAEFARVATRWVLVFSDVESDHLWRADLESAGLDYVRTGAWVKVGSTPQFSGDRPATGFEAITICHPKGRKRWNGGGRHAVWTTPIVLKRGRNDERLHPTQKPEPLANSLVDLFSDEGETILDAFGGSGTFSYAAAIAGRKSIVFEDQEEHCEVIAKRMTQRPTALDFGEASA